MFPSVPPPRELVGKSIDCKLKPGWIYDTQRGVFVGPKGEVQPPALLPKGARISYKVPSLSDPSRRSLTPAERELGRYLQVILPTARSAEKLLPLIKSWPAIEDAHAAPEIGLP